MVCRVAFLCSDAHGVIARPLAVAIHGLLEMTVFGAMDRRVAVAPRSNAKQFKRN